MIHSAWQLCPPRLDDDERFLKAVMSLHEGLYTRHFADDPMSNQNIGFQLRAFRRVGEWRLVLVLTPWMLSRFMAPLCDPGVDIPATWQAENRTNRDFVLLGPKVSFELLGSRQTAHLSYHPILGHYLLQPIVLAMTGYKSPDEVFEAWNHVIQTRDENMEKFRKDCAWQKEVSRREFFGGFRQRSSQD